MTARDAKARRAIKYARQQIRNVQSYGGVWASVQVDDLALLCEIAEESRSGQGVLQTDEETRT
jgi:hypothetical protein